MRRFHSFLAIFTFVTCTLGMMLAWMIGWLASMGVHQRYRIGTDGRGLTTTMSTYIIGTGTGTDIQPS
jgi:hypothetical protein